MTLMDSVGFQPFQLESLRARLRKNAEKLIRFGRAATGMCSPEANFGHPPRSVFVASSNAKRAMNGGGDSLVMAGARAF
jgi:hypothetical protein